MGRLDEPFEHVQRRGLDAVAEQELAVAGKALHRRDQPQDETVMSLQRRARRPGVVRAPSARCAIGSATGHGIFNPGFIHHLYFAAKGGVPPPLEPPMDVKM